MAQANRLPQRVLLDSYHAHNFLHLGLKPGQYSYHQYSALRRGFELVSNRGCEIEELLVGPITPADLQDCNLLVLNLVSADRPPFLVSEITAIVEFVNDGGGLLCVTDHSNCYFHQYRLLPLWHELGLIPTFETVGERDPRCQLSSGGPAWTLIREWEKHPVASGISAVAMQTSGRVEGPGQIAFTSENAWADAGALPMYGEGVTLGLYGDFVATDAEAKGKQAVVLARDIGRGRVVVIADQNCVGDALISFAQNWKLWLNAVQWCGHLDFTPPKQAEDSPFGLSVHCFDPFASGSREGRVTQFDFAAQDDEQYHHFWVWMNRHLWASCGPAVWRPAEYQSGRQLLIGVIESLQVEAFRKAMLECVGKGGVVMLLNDSNDLHAAQQAMFEKGSPGFNELRNKVTAILHAGESPDGHKAGRIADYFVMRPEAVVRATVMPSSNEPSSNELASKETPPTLEVHRIRVANAGGLPKGEVWLCLGAETLSNKFFGSPGTQPNTQQKAYEAWILGLFKSLESTDSARD